MNPFKKLANKIRQKRRAKQDAESALLDSIAGEPKNRRKAY